MVSGGVMRSSVPFSTLSNSPQLLHSTSDPSTVWSGSLQTGQSAWTIFRRSHQKKPTIPTMGRKITNPMIIRADLTNQPKPRLPSSRQMTNSVSQGCSRGRLVGNGLGLLFTGHPLEMIGKGTKQARLKRFSPHDADKCYFTSKPPWLECGFYPKGWEPVENTETFNFGSTS